MKDKKITRKDLEIKKGKIAVDCIVVDGKTINLTPVSHQSLETFITHENCSDCGVEFKKDYSYRTKCSHCMLLDEIERYNQLQLVEWDRVTPLCIFNDDTYFFTTDDIIEYLDGDPDLEIEDLMLCVCKESSFKEIDYDHFADEIHEDWEPSEEMVLKLKEFNEFLRSEATNTWFQGKERVTLNREVLNG